MPNNVDSIMSGVISLEGLMKHTGVTDEQLDQECDELHLHELSDDIVNYQEYGPQLHLKASDITEIEKNPRVFHSVKLITAAVFNKWHRIYGSRATYRVLVGVALKLKDGAGAKRICQICAEGVSPHRPTKKEVCREPSSSTTDSGEKTHVKMPRRRRNVPVHPNSASDSLPRPDSARTVINKPAVVCVGVLAVLLVTGLVWKSIPNSAKSINITEISGATNKATKVEEKQKPIQTDLKEEEQSSPSKFPDAKESSYTDCETYSKQLFSQTTFSYPKKHRIKGQVEMFNHTILLAGRSPYLTISGDPPEYEASALDMDMTHDTREHNTGASSRVSLEDAVEKTLVKICEILRRKGYGELSSR